MTQKIRGRHRRQGQRAAVMGALPIAIAISYSSVAQAAPQPGVTDEAQPDEASPSTAQPGVTTDSESDKAAPSTERTKEAKPKSYWVAPPVEYNNVPTREVPTYYYEEIEDESTGTTQYVAPEPVQVQELHLPEAVEPVAPIEAPEDKLRVGDYVSEKPEWLSQEDLEKTNNTAAVAEAQLATFWNSVGVDGSRSDLVAGATIAGAAVGGVTGAAVVGIPVAVVAGVVANVPGCIAGGAAGGLIGGAVTIGTATIPAAAIGCGVGAAAASAGASAAAGIPAAVVGGTVGAVIGGVAGAVGGATYETLNPEINPDVEQDDKASPEADVAPAPPVEAAPPAPRIDKQAITDGTRHVITQVEALPGGSAVVGDVRAFNEVAPQLADNANDFAAEQDKIIREAALKAPSGKAFTDLLNGIGAATAPAAADANDVATAVGAGIEA